MKPFIMYMCNNITKRKEISIGKSIECPLQTPEIIKLVIVFNLNLNLSVASRRNKIYLQMKNDTRDGRSLKNLIRLVDNVTMH